MDAFGINMIVLVEHANQSQIETIGLGNLRAINCATRRINSAYATKAGMYW